MPKIDWPTPGPVWSFWWIPPNQSSGINGSGLELRYVYYKRRFVLWKAHVPILNVKYAPGGCGGSNLCYRDWANELAAFDANNVIQPGYAEPTSPTITVCDHPGSDSGAFEGVAVEKGANELILTTQMRAGWYRYIQQWIFNKDGIIQPVFKFTAVNTSPCVSKSHVHHVYWRLDFDIDGFPNDVIEEYNDPPLWPGGPNWHRKTERNRLRDYSRKRKWRVRDKRTGRKFEITPGPNDGTAVGDPFAVADIWILRYHGNEIDDGAATCQAQLNNYINGENVDGQDVVLWYAAHVLHPGGAQCDIAGPTLKALDW